MESQTSLKETNMNDTLRCYKCNQVPTVKIEDNANGLTVVLVCELHGYEAQGSSLDQARVHWNQFISYAKVQAA